MPAVWSATDVSLILLRKRDTFTKVLPSKMFEAMAMTRPIVLGVEGEAKALLDGGRRRNRHRAGERRGARRRRAAPRRRTRRLRARLGARGAEHVRRHYDRAALAHRYIDVLESAVAAPAARDRGARRPCPRRADAEPSPARHRIRATCADRANARASAALGAPTFVGVPRPPVANRPAPVARAQLPQPLVSAARDEPAARGGAISSSACSRVDHAHDRRARRLARRAAISCGA